MQCHCEAISILAANACFVGDDVYTADCQPIVNGPAFNQIGFRL
jgi:hypothetical protein